MVLSLPRPVSCTRSNGEVQEGAARVGISRRPPRHRPGTWARARRLIHEPRQSRHLASRALRQSSGEFHNLLRPPPAIRPSWSPADHTPSFETLAGPKFVPAIISPPERKETMRRAPSAGVSRPRMHLVITPVRVNVSPRQDYHSQIGSRGGIREFPW